MSYKGRIKFGNREWLVIDNVTYEDINYYYIAEDISEQLEKLQNIEEYEGPISLEFIYKVSDENYRNVTDKELISKLLSLVAIRDAN